MKEKQQKRERAWEAEQERRLIERLKVERELEQLREQVEEQERRNETSTRGSPCRFL